MTAVQWLVDELEKYELYSKISYQCLGEIEIALEMEKEQIMNAWYNGFEENRPYVDHSEEYYNKTYGNKESNMSEKPTNHIVDTNKMVSDKVLFEQATVAMEEMYGSRCETEIDAYFRGAKWMEKQLKEKQ